MVLVSTSGLHVVSAVLFVEKQGCYDKLSCLSGIDALHLQRMQEHCSSPQSTNKATSMAESTTCVGQAVHLAVVPKGGQHFSAHTCRCVCQGPADMALRHHHAGWEGKSVAAATACLSR